MADANEQTIPTNSAAWAVDWLRKDAAIRGVDAERLRKHRRFIEDRLDAQEELCRRSVAACEKTAEAMTKLAFYFDEWAKHYALVNRG